VNVRDASPRHSSDGTTDGAGSDRDRGLWDRRDVLTAAASTAGLALAPGLARAGAAGRLHAVVADERFGASRAFAAEAERSGRRIVWTRGDVTSLWYDELDLLWRKDRAPLAGLTDYAAFFCLERLALDRGLRVAFKGEHRLLASGTLSHAYAGPNAVVTPQTLAILSGHAWPAQTARLALASLGARPKGGAARTATPAVFAQPPLMVSWVLAPRPDRRTI
jgi:hypothetical protein